jgi:uncharacterized damage-inducible protein DinB
MVDDLPALYRYHRWADEQYLAALARLTPEQYVARLGGSFPSVRATFVHLLAAAIIWEQRLSGQQVTTVPDEEEYPSYAAAAARLREQHDRLAAIVARTTPAALASTFDYRNTRGEEVSLPLWAVLRHVVNHGTYHRGQLANMLRLLGETPPATDLSLWAAHHA